MQIMEPVIFAVKVTILAIADSLVNKLLIGVEFTRKMGFAKLANRVSKKPLTEKIVCLISTSAFHMIWIKHAEHVPLLQ
jgi:hypothetical protein